MSLQEWAERVLALAFRELKLRLPTRDFGPYDENMVIRLEFDADSSDWSDGDCLPDKIRNMSVIKARKKCQQSTFGDPAERELGYFFMLHASMAENTRETEALLQGQQQELRGEEKKKIIINIKPLS
ncbi:hypothetical protein LguiB_023549 [Lonicera macranthoides]